MDPLDPPDPERLRLRSAAFDRLSAFAAVLDHRGVIVDTNAAWRDFAVQNGGTPGDTGIGVDYTAVCDRAAASGDEDAAEVAEGLRRILSGELEHFDLEYPCAGPDGERWYLLQASPVGCTAGTGVVLFHLDITSRKQLELQLIREAEHDELTGVPNRRTVVAFLDEQLARRSSPPTALLFFDLDGFKAVNDTYGHQAGDDVLVQVVARARRVVRSTDLVGRYGGDEFVVVCPGATSARLAALADRLGAVMSEPFAVGPHVVQIGASVGCAVAHPGVTADALISAADERMYLAKQGTPVACG